MSIETRNWIESSVLQRAEYLRIFAQRITESESEYLPDLASIILGEIKVFMMDEVKRRDRYLYLDKYTSLKNWYNKVNFILDKSIELATQLFSMRQEQTFQTVEENLSFSGNDISTDYWHIENRDIATILDQLESLELMLDEYQLSQNQDGKSGSILRAFGSIKILAAFLLLVYSFVMFVLLTDLKSFYIRAVLFLIGLLLYALSMWTIQHNSSRMRQ